MHKFQGYIPECQTHRETTVCSQGATPVGVPLITHWLAVIDTAGTKGPFMPIHLDGSMKGTDACMDRPGIQSTECLQVVYLSLELCDFAKSLVSVSSNALVITSNVLKRPQTLSYLGPEDLD